ncbi:hypothetical protein MKK69_20870 [Methylobacterium sp. J-026]|uniref:hypothetical protein n=1 Tax=Methylobacterium sp. J-026 TaxID=2836624 RepID=UPI001FBAFB91|nr:hypothetical protein [Methylobacterium sp. J-026]MCJ2136473.1 hypothetical protein [Methylobacterium sp. J-026]
MTILMAIALAVASVGVATTVSAYRYAPVSSRIAGWDVAFVSGVSAAALGGLGALVQVFTA